MTYILIVGALLLGGIALYAFNKNTPVSQEQTELIESVKKENIKMDQDTIKADYSYAITGQGKINDVIFSMAGVRKKEIDGVKVDHIKIDVDEFIYAKEGDTVTLGENLTIQIIKITNPPHPQIGKVYFNIVK
jgi:molybdenum cofactor biosynthesis enzyme MoaA